MKKCVKSFLLISTILFVVLNCAVAFAHSGRTDSAGGHNDNDTGEYHYHEGHKAHYHPDGTCPYGYDMEGATNDVYAKKDKKPLVIGNNVPNYIIIFMYVIFVFALIFLIIKTDASVGLTIACYLILCLITSFFDIFSKIFIISIWIVFFVPLVILDIFIFTIFFDELKKKK